MPRNDDTEVLLLVSQTEERELIKEMLARIGCKVTDMDNENDCLAEFSQNKKYNLILFDQNTEGIDVASFVKKLEYINLLTPVAMMATLPSEFYQKKYGNSNIDFLIFKPFEFAQLSRLIQEAIQLCKRLRGTETFAS